MEDPKTLYLGRNVAFSHRFRKPPGVTKPFGGPRNAGCQIPGPISTLRAKRCVFASFREAGGHKSPSEVPDTLSFRFPVQFQHLGRKVAYTFRFGKPLGPQKPFVIPQNAVSRAKRCVFASFHEAPGGHKALRRPPKRWPSDSRSKSNP